MFVKQPVLVAGAGPVGLSLAVALIQKGIPVQVFEELPELSSDLRGAAIHPPTLEMFSEWGFLDKVLEETVRVTQLQYWERASRELVANFDYSLISGYTPYPFRLQLHQRLLTHILKPMVGDSEFGAVHMQHKIIDFADHGTHISVVCETPDGVRTFQGAYLCGADGARSTVRKGLSLQFEGTTYIDRFLMVNTDIDLNLIFPGIGPAAYIFDPTEWVITMQLPGWRRVVFRVADHEIEEEITAEASIRERMAKSLNIDINFKIVQPQVYRVHQRVASTFHVGRVLLLGDAAHVNNPAGGMGLNSGIHDVHNLVTKLEAVLAGASDDLLDRYSEQRRAFAMENVQKRSHSNYQALSAKDNASRQARNQELQAKAAHPELARQHLLQFSMLGDRIGKIYRISELAKRIGKSSATLRRWDAEGKLLAKRLPNGHRYYNASDEHKALGIIARAG